MIIRMLAGGVFAGFAAGLFAALLHFAFVQKLILLGEQYESGAIVHFQTGSGQAASGHDATGGHDATAADDTAGAMEGHAHPATGGEDSTFKRNALTVAFTALIYAAYGILLAAGFALAEHFGIRITAREGILWGLAGFATFQLAPAMGLAPELPGTVGADLGARQVWWLGTVLATATGIALLVYGRTVVTAMIGGALLAAPHVIGAPHLDTFYGTAPPELGAAFAANVLGVGFATWAVLGWLAGRLWQNSAA